MGKRFLGIPFEIKLSEGTEGSVEVPQRLQLFKAGTYRDPRYKKFSITPQMLRAIKKNFDDKVRGIDIAVDYKHDTDDKASGWVKSLELSENDTVMFADIEWTPTGRRVLSDKEFRYISPDYHENYVDNETGKTYGPTLLGAGLTNRPVIKGMAPIVQLSEINPEGEKEMDELEQLKEENKKLSERITALEGDNKKLSEVLDGKSAEDVVKENKELKEKNEELETKAAEAEKQKQLSEKKSKFDKMLSEGKACEAQREAYMSGDMDKFTELAQPMKLSEEGSKKKPGDNESADFEDRVIKLAEEKMKADPKLDKVTAISAAHEELRKK